eukprot:2874220-Rhodomonas_salina.4
MVWRDRSSARERVGACSTRQCLGDQRMCRRRESEYRAEARVCVGYKGGYIGGYIGDAASVPRERECFSGTSVPDIGRNGVGRWRVYQYRAPHRRGVGASHPVQRSCACALVPGSTIRVVITGHRLGTA